MQIGLKSKFLDYGMPNSRENGPLFIPCMRIWTLDPPFNAEEHGKFKDKSNYLICQVKFYQSFSLSVKSREYILLLQP